MADPTCRECARLQDMIRVRQEQLDAAVRLLHDHLAGIDDDTSLVVIRPDGHDPGRTDPTWVSGT